MLRTGLCDLLDIRYPVMQAGMGVYKGALTSPELVAAVSNAGGMGCIGGMGLEPEELRSVIRETRKLTDRPFGVDLLLPTKVSATTGSRDEIREDIRKNHTEQWRLVEALFERYGLPAHRLDRSHGLTRDYTSAQVEVVFEEKVPVFVIALGDPALLVERAREAGTKLGGMAGSIGNVRRHLSAGVDFIICQGGEAGGHVGAIGTFPLIPQGVDLSGNVPVAAAGGIADGRGLVAALSLGAQAAWCGTAFLFAEEANIHPVHREQLIAGRSEDFVASRVFTGKPSRIFRNEVLEIWAREGVEPLPMPHQQVLIEDFVDAAWQASRLDLVNNPAGQIAGMLGSVKPAARILDEMVEDAAAIIDKLAELKSGMAGKRHRSGS